MGVGKIVLTVLGTLALLGLGTCASCAWFMGQVSSNVEEQRLAAARQLAEEKRAKTELLQQCAETVPVPWSDIVTQLKANEVATVSRWKGNCVHITGTVEQIESTFNDLPRVIITTGEKYAVNRALCEPASFTKADSLRSGQRLTVWGIGGDELVGSLKIQDCTWR